MGGVSGMLQIVRDGLRAGLGIEDIAVRDRVPVDQVRLWVRALRRNGELTIIYGRTAHTTAPKEKPQT